MKSTILLIFLTFMLMVSQSQEVNIALDVVATSGGYTVNKAANLSVSWTVGQTAFTTLSAANLVVTQGFHQGNLLVTSVEPSPTLPSFGIKVYPNPTSMELFILVENSNAYGYYQIEVFDLSGRKVIELGASLESSSPYRLSVDGLRSGAYLLRVWNSQNARPQVFKFIKE